LGLQGFTFVDHTADIAARLEAPTLDALFAAAAGALIAALTLPERVDARATLTLHLEASDLELLLVDWTGELLYRFETDGFLVSDATVRVTEAPDAGGEAPGPPSLRFGEARRIAKRGGGRWRLDAAVSGETRDPARHPLKVLVKAVTFHGLKIEERDGRYETLLVFDI
jgi:SHS2 domain-containing protein